MAAKVKIPIESKATKIIRDYNGSNDHILYYKKLLRVNPSYVIGKKFAKYVIKNHNVNPTIINKRVNIHPYVGAELQGEFKTVQTPTSVFINKTLAVDKDEVHIWGKLFDEDPYYQSIFISKSAFVKNTEPYDIDWSKYDVRPPKPHQKPAVEKLVTNSKFILADDMGLGKTVSAIIAAKEIGAKSILIVCPATVKLNWKKEIEFYEDSKDIAIINGTEWKSAKWVIINYDILRNFHHLPQRGVKASDLPITPIQMAKFDLVIADEAHKLKDSKSNRSRIFNNFIQDIPNRWLLTGTPIVNKPIDYFNLLQICDSPLSDNWQKYVKTYCDGKQFTNRQKKKYWVAGGHSNLGDLKKYSENLLFRRMKTEIADLPDKIIRPIYLPIESTVMYAQYIKEYKEWLIEMDEKGEKIPPWSHLTKLIKVRQMLSLDKINSTIALANDLIEQDKKVVIFSCFTDTLGRIAEAFGNTSVKLDGTTSQVNRQRAVDAFQTNSKIKVFCANIVAGGVGITLTAGEVVIFNDLDWVPANHVQAEDRCLRIGQVNNVNVFYPLIDETLDVIMFDALTMKKSVINTVLGDTDQAFNETMAKYVIEKIKHQSLGMF